MDNNEKKIVLTQYNGDDINSAFSLNFPTFEQPQNEIFYDNDENISSKAIFQSKNVISVDIKVETKDEKNEKLGQNEIKTESKKEPEIIVIDKVNKNKNEPKDINKGTKTENVDKEENNTKGKFYLFTPKSDDITKEYSEKPPFKDIKFKQKEQRKVYMDNTAKKVKKTISDVFIGFFGIDKKKISFMEFNQVGTKAKNKAYLNMSVKEFLLFTLIQTKKKENNEYILTEDDKNYIESLANDDERKKFVLKMKMQDVYNEFFESQEYQDLIKKLKLEINIYDDYYYYMYTFIEKNKRFVDYYNEEKKTKK